MLAVEDPRSAARYVLRGFLKAAALFDGKKTVDRFFLDGIE
jgi:hypothetical protein